MSKCTPPEGANEPLPMIPAPPGPLGLRPIESVHIRGRGFPDAYLTWSSEGDEVTLHVHDYQTEESWVYLTLSAEHLAELLMVAVQSRDGERVEPAVSHCLRAIGKRMT